MDMPTIKPAPPAKRNMGRIAGRVSVAALIALLLVGFLLIFRQVTGSEWGRVDAETYQAVFLDNGQVYFGRLTETRGEFYRLEEVYYFPSDSAALEAQSQVPLIKLGNEVHGPQDAMEIRAEHILFVENLKTDGKVVEAIRAYRLP
jgi:hypothetical protein